MVKRVEKKRAGVNHLFHKRRMILDFERQNKSGLLYLIPPDVTEVIPDKYVNLKNVLDVYEVTNSAPENGS